MADVLIDGSIPLTSSLTGVYSKVQDEIAGSVDSLFTVTSADLVVCQVNLIFSHFGTSIEKNGLRTSMRMGVTIVDTNYSKLTVGRDYGASFCTINKEVYPWFYV